MLVLECDSRSPDPVGRELSNLTPGPFVLRELEFASMEGFLQSLKTPDQVAAAKLARMHGVTAWRLGQSFNSWKDSQLLYFCGHVIPRNAEAYQLLLDLAYDAQYDQNEAELKGLLRQTVGMVLRHPRGKNDTRDSVLTQSEYVSRLERLRWRALEESWP